MSSKRSILMLSEYAFEMVRQHTKNSRSVHRKQLQLGGAYYTIPAFP